MTQYLLFTLGTWHLCCKSTPPKKGGWFVENSSPGWCEWPLDWEGNDCWGCNWRGPEMCSKGRRKILPENELTSRFCNLPLVPCVWTLRYDMVFLLRIVWWTDLMFFFYYLQASGKWTCNSWNLIKDPEMLFIGGIQLNYERYMNQGSFFLANGF